MRKEGEVLRKWAKPLCKPGVAKGSSLLFFRGVGCKPLPFHSNIISSGRAKSLVQKSTLTMQTHFLLLNKAFSIISYQSCLTGEVLDT